MVISGLIKTSLLDYPNKISAIVFTQGCNFKCPYCHNPELNEKSSPGLISEEDFFLFVEKRKHLIEAVTITGGEPTIHYNLEDFIKQIRRLGLLIKLDTNGTNPLMLENILDAQLADYVAMDIKGPLKKYSLIAGRPVDTDQIKKSISLIMEKAPDYEFRTTLLPRLITREDFTAMLREIKGAKKYYLQFFRLSDKILDPQYADERPFSKKEMEELLAEAKNEVGDCEIR